MRINFKNFYLFSIPVDFNIAWLKIFFSSHLIVQLGVDGKVGVGEGVLYKTSSLKTLNLVLKEFKEFFQQEFSSFGQARQKLLKTFFSYPGLTCAFDLALWDLEGKIKKKPVFALLGKKKRNKVAVIEQIFVPENKIDLINQTKRILKKGTRVIKFKVGRNLEKDLEYLQLIQNICKDKIELKVDINQGLSFGQAIYFGKKIENLGITAWEEPIRFQDFSQLGKLRRKVRLPIILDESIQNKNDLRKGVKEKAFDMLNIKFSRLGGLTHSLQIIKLAKKNKIKINIGCSEELGIGTSAQLHLASFLASLKTMEALGSQRLGLDVIKERQEIKNGFLKAPSKRPGLGVSFDFRKLKDIGRKMDFVIINKSNAETPSAFYIQYFNIRLQSLFYNGLLFLRKKFNHYLWQKK